MKYRLRPLTSAIDESGQSYACRLARRLNLPLSHWCTDLGIKRADVLQGKSETIARVADQGGADPAVLMASTINRVDHQRYLLNGQLLTPPALRRVRLRGCLHCMKQQMQEGCVWDVSIQTTWFLSGIYTCPIHNLALTPMADKLNAGRQEWSLLTEQFIASSEAKHVPVERSPGEFETYITAAVKTGAPAIGGELNNMPLHVTMSLVPIIGQSLIYGTKAGEPQSDDEAIRAADTGYRALREPDGLEDALAQIDRGAGPRKANHGPQHRLGRHVIDWIARGARHPDFQPVRERIRTFILGNIPVHRGTMLLGYPVEACRVHSSSTLQSLTGMSRQSLRSRLEEGGLLGSDQDKGELPIPAEEAEEWLARVNEGVSHQSALKQLGCTQRDLVELKRAGLIKPLSGGGIPIRTPFSRRSLEELLAGLLGAAAKTMSTPNGYVGFARLKRIPNCSFTQFVRAVLEGEFKGVACRPENHKMDGLEFDLEEARKFIAGEPLPGLVITELASYWKLTLSTVRALIEGGHLVTNRARHPVQKAMVTVVPYEAIGHFDETYVHAQRLALEMGLSRTELRQWLNDRSVSRAFDVSMTNSPFYRRADVTA